MDGKTLNAVSYRLVENIGDIMTLDDIPPDTTHVLTELMDKLFKAANCRPTCHACSRKILVGMKFKLATHEERDVMLCGKHSLKHLTDPIEVEKLKEAAWKRAHQARLRAGLPPGYSRPTTKNRWG